MSSPRQSSFEEQNVDSREAVLLQTSLRVMRRIEAIRDEVGIGAHRISGRRWLCPLPSISFLFPSIPFLRRIRRKYKRKGNAVATDEQLARIKAVPKRELMRCGINQHTLEKICHREPVRAEKLAECLRVLEEYKPSPDSLQNRQA